LPARFVPGVPSRQKNLQIAMRTSGVSKTQLIRPSVDRDDTIRYKRSRESHRPCCVRNAEAISSQPPKRKPHPYGAGNVDPCNSATLNPALNETWRRPSGFTSPMAAEGNVTIAERLRDDQPVPKSRMHPRPEWPRNQPESFAPASYRPTDSRSRNQSVRHQIHYPGPIRLITAHP